MARHVVRAFRADAARAGAVAEVGRLVEERCRNSADFAAFWREHDVRNHREGVKRLHHPMLGVITLAYSGSAIDGQPDLGIIDYNPVTIADAERIHTLMAERQPATA